MAILPEIQRAVQLHSAGQLDQAERIYRDLLARNPDEPDCNHMLGLVLYQKGRLAEAEPLMRRSLQLVDRLPQWHINFAMLLHALGRLDQAIAILQRVIEQSPGNVEAHINLGKALADAGQEQEALAHLQIALKLQPEHIGALSALAFLYQRSREFERAASLCRRARQLDPTSSVVLNQLSYILQALGDIDGAVETAADATQINPNDSEAWFNLGTALVNLGDTSQAQDCFRRVLEIQPNHYLSRANLLVAMHTNTQIDRATMLKEHRMVQSAHIDQLHVSRMAHLNDRSPDRPLRVAYVSPDFRQHPVASFIEPILRSHDASRFIISCYADERGKDEVTRRLRKYPANWHDISYLSDARLAQKINANREDILIDLAGHTANGRLLALAFKPAPVQITYLGYLNTTGMDAMDYRLTDAVADPPGESDRFYTEKLLRLPCFFCYQPPAEAPAVNPLPAASSRTIHFGSLNHTGKFTSPVVRLWSRLLEIVPHSKLILTVGAGEQRVREIFAHHQVDANRLILVPRKPLADYYAMYHSIDIALDPFPFNGHTTTCDALWMGVPVITLAGQTYASRTCTATLTHLGLTQLIAKDTDGYLRIAGELTTDLNKLAALRASLRTQMSESIITNANAFTKNLEHAYRRVWQDWCAQPPSTT
ncbi:MAG TPA: tetratricopeptide repeat protein [Tepidisphaeraceae bacterium]|nr:tetratricopeptide repeat protein [Tepidisphaeraceae bacterium]